MHEKEARMNRGLLEWYNRACKCCFSMGCINCMHEVVCMCIYIRVHCLSLCLCMFLSSWWVKWVLLWRTLSLSHPASGREVVLLCSSWLSTHGLQTLIAFRPEAISPLYSGLCASMWLLLCQFALGCMCRQVDAWVLSSLQWSIHPQKRQTGIIY